MNKWIRKHRFRLLRRIVQVSLLILFAGSNWFGWKILMGNLSTAYVFESFYLTDPHSVLQTLLSGFLVGTDLFVGALIVFLFYAIFAGRAFCSWVCPVNIVSDSVQWISQRLKLDIKGAGSLINNKSRYYILGLGLVLSIITGVAAFEVINPITMLHRGIIFGFGLGWTIVLMVILFDLVLMKYGWCGHLCPLGAFYALPARYSLLKVKHLQDKCTLCNKCFMVCPEAQVLQIIGTETGLINSGECTNCGRCIEVCEDNALKFSINNYKTRRLS